MPDSSVAIDHVPLGSACDSLEAYATLPDDQGMIGGRGAGARVGAG